MCNGQRFFESGRGQSILGWPAKDRSTILCHTGQMDEDQLFLRPAKPPPAGISEHTYRIIDDLDCIKAQLSQLSRIPTRRELIHFGVWAALGLCVLALVGVRVWMGWVWACSPL